MEARGIRDAHLTSGGSARRDPRPPWSPTVRAAPVRTGPGAGRPRPVRDPPDGCALWAGWRLFGLQSSSACVHAGDAFGSPPAAPALLAVCAEAEQPGRPLWRRQSGTETDRRPANRVLKGTRATTPGARGHSTQGPRGGAGRGCAGRWRPRVPGGPHSAAGPLEATVFTARQTCPQSGAGVAAGRRPRDLQQAPSLCRVRATVSRLLENSWL